MAPKSSTASTKKGLAATLRRTPSSKVAKTPRTKARVQKRLPHLLERPVAPPGRAYPVVILKTGLVSMEKPPDYLIVTVQRNAIESPLLRIPPELRNRIFELAMGGNKVSLKRRQTEFSGLRWRQSTKSVFHGRATHLADRRRRQGTAFHLPEVCRQIYSETATLGYVTNTFFFDGILAPHGIYCSTPDDALRTWGKTLNEAQRSSIWMIEPHPTATRLYLKDSSWDERPLSETYPMLQILFVTKWIERTFLPNNIDKEWVRRKVQEKEGDQVKVVFTDTTSKSIRHRMEDSRAKGHELQPLK